MHRTKRNRDQFSPGNLRITTKKSNSRQTPENKDKTTGKITLQTGSTFSRESGSASSSRPRTQQISRNLSKQFENDLNVNKDKMSFNEFKRNLIDTLKDEEGAAAFRDLLQPIIPDNTKEIAALLDLVKTQKTKIDILENEVEILKQQSLHKSLLISGVNEETNKSTEEVVAKLCREIGVNLHPIDCDGAFRIYRRDKNNTVDNPNKTPPMIQINLTTNRKKTEIMQNKKKLKNLQGQPIYINEKLTPKQGEIFAWTRRMVKTGKLNSTWSRDGKVFVKRKAEGRPEAMTSTEYEQSKSA